MTEQRPRKVAIIGASNIGLLYMRIISRKGYNVTCFEQRSNVGGMWNFETTPEVEAKGYAELNPDGSSPCAYSQLCLNTSKQVFFNSDVLYDGFEIYPDLQWLTGKQFLETFNTWSKKYNLEDNINFNTEVVKLNKLNDSWIVSFKNQQNEIENQKFDFVVMCTGSFRFARLPKIENMSTFKGIAIHSSQVRLENVLFKDKTVLVIGSSFSGTDMAYHALKNKAKKVYWSESRDPKKYGHWLIDKCPPGSDPKKPFDMNFNRYLGFDRPDLLQSKLKSISTPLHEFNKGATVNLPFDQLGLTDVTYLIEQEQIGKLEKLGPLKFMTLCGAEMESGRILADVDVVLYCTGFDTRYPLLDEIWSPEEQIKTELYYHQIPVDERLHGLAIPGTVDGRSAMASLHELLARWLCKFWLTRDYDHEGRLFTQTEINKMKEAIQQVKAAKKAANIPFKVVGDSFGMFDTVANDIGCLPPDYRSLIAKGTQDDVELGIALMMGPIYSMQYRIQGDDAYPGAGKNLVTVTKTHLGEDNFNSLVQSAKENPKEFFKSHGVEKETYVVKPCFPSII